MTADPVLLVDSKIDSQADKPLADTTVGWVGLLVHNLMEYTEIVCSLGSKLQSLPAVGGVTIRVPLIVDVVQAENAWLTVVVFPAMFAKSAIPAATAKATETVTDAMDKTIKFFFI